MVIDVEAFRVLAAFLREARVMREEGANAHATRRSIRRTGVK